MPHLQDPASTLFLANLPSLWSPFYAQTLSRLLPHQEWIRATFRVMFRHCQTHETHCKLLMYLALSPSTFPQALLLHIIAKIYWARITCWVLCWELYTHDSPIPPIGLPLLWPSLLSSCESHPQPRALESNTFAQTLYWTYWVWILTFPLRSWVTLGIFFNLSMPQFPHLCNRSNDSAYLVIENGVIVSFDWDNTCEVPSIVSGMPEVANKCQAWLHMLFIHVLPLEASYANWVVWLTAVPSRSSPLLTLPRPCLTLSGWERGSLPIGLRVSCSYIQQSTYLVGVIVIVSCLWCWILKGQDLSSVICVPRGPAQGLIWNRLLVSAFQCDPWMEEERLVW